MADFDQILQSYQHFPSEVQSLMLSTLNSDGTPDTSYAPFVMTADRAFYIFVSGLSSHTQNLLRSPVASFLLIEDESQASQIFARRRLSYTCRAERLERGTPAWDPIVDQFEHRFGGLIPMLRQLSDFQIFRLTPYQGRFVVGFGAAYAVNPEDLNQLLPQALGKPAGEPS